MQETLKQDISVPLAYKLVHTFHILFTHLANVCTYQTICSHWNWKDL